MNVHVQPHLTTKRDLPFECVALVLQGGGALGAYQAGVYEALAEANIDPDWVDGLYTLAVRSGGNEEALPSNLLRCRSPVMAGSRRSAFEPSTVQADVRLRQCDTKVDAGQESTGGCGGTARLTSATNRGRKVDEYHA
jgi:hypothetical protein